MNQDDVAKARHRRPDLQELREERRILDERHRRLGMIGEVFDLLRRKCVVDADGGSARMHDPEVGDDVLGDVARDDKAELAGAEAELPQRQRYGRDLLAIAGPREHLPIAVLLPAQGGPVAPLLFRIGEDRADRLARDRRVDVGSLGDYVHPYLLARVVRRPPRTYTISQWGLLGDLRSVAAFDRHAGRAEPCLCPCLCWPAPYPL